MKDKLFLVSTGIYEELKTQLTQVGQILVVPDSKKCYEAINHHVDIHLLHMNEVVFFDQATFDVMYDDLTLVKTIIYNEAQKNYIFGRYQLKPIDSILTNRYPLSVCFNAKCYGNLFVHNLKLTEPVIMDYVKHTHMQTIQVKQGYTGCSLVLLNERCGITSDLGIYNVLRKQGMSLLLIKKGYIELKGFEHGFIGGSTFVYDQTVVFNGDSMMHPDGTEIERFIREQGYDIIKVKDKVLKDVGSGIALDLT